MELIPKPKEINIKKMNSFSFQSVNFFEFKKNVENKDKLKIRRLLLELSKFWGARWLEEDLRREDIECSDFVNVKMIFNFDEKIKYGGYKIEFNKSENFKEISISFSNFEGASNSLSSIYQIQIQNKMFFEGTIVDEPKLKWRGTLMDISRHFYGADELKKIIFIQWLYKQNILHLHLTDDQGWRIEIKSMPELLERGSWRYMHSLNRSTYGGHIRQSELSELVDYASLFSIDVLPEIDLPGHLHPIIYTYPDLACKGVKLKPIQRVNGVNDQIICMSNPESLSAIKNILKEVIEIFPFEYIHIGGDEAPLSNLEHCDRCKSYMQKSNISSGVLLQKEFIKKIVSFLKENNRKVICYDDLIESEKIEGLTLNFWRSWLLSKNKNALNKLLDNCSELIYNPNNKAYFDFSQTANDWKLGIDSNWYNSLENTYSLEVFKNISKENANKLLGSECCLWTEEIRSFPKLTKKWLPRMLAMQEVLWGTKTNYDDFKVRLKKNTKILDKLNIEYEKEGW